MNTINKKKTILNLIRSILGRYTLSVSLAQFFICNCFLNEYKRT